VKTFGIAVGAVAASALYESFGMTVEAWAWTCLALSMAGYMAGRFVDATERSADELEYLGKIASLPYGLALGHVRLGDLAHVEVPDAPPADMGGES